MILLFLYNFNIYTRHGLAMTVEKLGPCDFECNKWGRSAKDDVTVISHFLCNIDSRIKKFLCCYCSLSKI